MRHVKEIKKFIHAFDNHQEIQIPRIAPDSENAPAQHLWIAAWMVEYLRLFVDNLPILGDLSPEEYRRYQDSAYDSLVHKYGQIISYGTQKDFDTTEEYVDGLAKGFWYFGNYMSPTAEKYNVTKA